MAVATAGDVSARVGRPLTTHETTRVNALLQDAEVEIYRLAPNRLTDPGWKNAVISVECAVVIRAARLADNLDSVVPGPQGVEYQSLPATQGVVYLRRSEKRTLGIENTASVAKTGCRDDTVLDHEEGWPETWPWWGYE